MQSLKRHLIALTPVVSIAQDGNVVTWFEKESDEQYEARVK